MFKIAGGGAEWKLLRQTAAHPLLPFPPLFLFARGHKTFLTLSSAAPREGLVKPPRPEVEEWRAPRSALHTHTNTHASHSSCVLIRFFRAPARLSPSADDSLKSPQIRHAATSTPSSSRWSSPTLLYFFVVALLVRKSSFY